MTPECTYCRNPAPYHIFDDAPICSDCLRKEINSQKKSNPHPLDLLTSTDHTTLDILNSINVTAPTPEHFTKILKLRKEAKENTLQASDQLEQLRQISNLPQETIESIAIRWKEFYCTNMKPVAAKSWYNSNEEMPIEVFMQDVEYAEPLSEQGNCILEVRASESID
jgi:hypothetical protein